TVSLILQPLDEGDYRLIVRSGDNLFEDPLGHDLDGEFMPGALDGTPTGDGVAGGDYMIEFRILEPPVDLDGQFELVDPLGSQVYRGHWNTVVSFAEDTDSGYVNLDEGELLNLSLTGEDVAAHYLLELI